MLSSGCPNWRAGDSHSNRHVLPARQLDPKRALIAVGQFVDRHVPGVDDVNAERSIPQACGTFGTEAG